jgi:hypothetical protein
MDKQNERRTELGLNGETVEEIVAERQRQLDDRMWAWLRGGRD